MDALITCSTIITASRLQEAFVAPQVNITPTEFTVDSTKVFLRSEEVSIFKEAFNSYLLSRSDYVSPSISCLRHLTSYFNHTLTYAYFRSTLDNFNDTKFMPVTVFTLCDTVDKDGYGSNLVGSHLHKAKQKIASNVKARLLDLYS